MKRVAGAAFFFVVVVACGSFGEANGGAREDAGGDASAADATAADAAADGGTCPALGPSKCTTVTKRAADFTNGVTADFSPYGDATIEADGACTPRSLRATTTVTNGAGVPAGARASVPGIFKSVRVAYAIRGPRDLLKGTYVEPGCAVTFSIGGGPATVLRLDIRDGGGLNHGASVIAGGTGADPLISLDDLLDADERARFRTVVAEYAWSTLGPSAISASVSIDGQSAKAASYGLLVAPDAVLVECGIRHADQGNGTHVFDIDDVVVELCE
jgi:hypothetical protein